MANGTEADDGRGLVGHGIINTACKLTAANVYCAGYAACFEFLFFAHIYQYGSRADQCEGLVW